MPPFPAPGHDHARCLEAALETARGVCAAQGVRLTPLRERVLAILWRDHTPKGAYALLDALAESGHRTAPAAVYRTLDFLIVHGLAHRLASRNAYVGCPQPQAPHHAQFLICADCARVAELTEPALDADIAGAAARAGFAVDHAAVEVTGHCPACRAAEA